jgi:hypothetical protein
MDVEIDLFSGRPNPRVRLDPQAAEELMRRLAALRPSTGQARPRDKLGYRGLRIQTEPSGSPVAEVVVSGGVVVVRDVDGRESWRDDPGRRLERWLVESLASEMNSDLVALLRHDLADAE